MAAWVVVAGAAGGGVTGAVGAVGAVDAAGAIGVVVDACCATAVIGDSSKPAIEMTHH
jgi:hypothetical protein